MQAHHSEVQDILQHLEVDAKTGLSAETVQKRIIEYGENKLEEGKKKTYLQRFMEQFKDVMIIILLFAALISFFVAIYEKEGLFEPFLILFIVLLNAVIGVVQEGKAEKAMEALKKLSALRARVLRDGKEQIIDAVKLVPGDIIKLEAGDFVPADARIIESSSLKSEESSLTGESVPVEKDGTVIIDERAPIGDRFNMIYSGCSITYGTTSAVVTATGMKTEIGKIANLLNTSEDTQTPLQLKLAQLGKYIGFVAMAICAVIFVIGVISGMELIEIFMIAVALAVSAIPEGLPAIVTVVLAIGVQRMVKKHAIIRKLPAVETLGSTSVICSDKTGTLTQNKMTLTKAYDAKSTTMESIGQKNSDAIRKLLTFATLCSEGQVDILPDGREELIGDPTETSIVRAAHHNGIFKEKLKEEYPRLATLPFDSNRKMMSSVHSFEGKILVVVKGAFDVVAGKCTQGDLESGFRITEELSREALRVLAVAYKILDEFPETISEEILENNLIFLGLLGMIDPPREEAKDAVTICRAAGIRPVMITGDHVITASAIAKELGILQDGDEAITGMELAEMTEDEMFKRVQSISVYARVSPEDKIRIVRSWQENGAVVSMTGDGVNDAPALKAADIGCAMGITGTDVAKGASDMILTDDNFATIVDAVKEGRGIYDNIRHTVGFLLGTNIGEVLVVLIAMILWQVTPFLAVQLLWINLITDSLPAIALGMEPIQDDVMDKKPKPKQEGIFAHGFGTRILLQGVLFALLTLISFVTVWSATGDIVSARTAAFITLGSSQIIHAFNMRSEKSLFKIGIFTNKNLNGAALISLLLMTAVVFTPPLTIIFGLTQLSLMHYLMSFGLAFVPLLVLETYKNLKKVIS